MKSFAFDGNDALTAAMRRYVTWMEVSHFSEFTIKNRWFMLTVFKQWCADHDITHFKAITRKTLEQYRRYLFYRRKDDGTTLCAMSQSHYLVSVRTFFSWLTSQNMLLCNPASELNLPKTGVVLPRHVLSPAEVDQVLDQPDLGTDIGIRDRTIMEIIYSSGIRRLELVRLETRDVNLDRGLLLVRNGKGRKDRMVPIGTRACVWIERYLQEVRPLFARKDSPGTLILSMRGTRLNEDSLSRRVQAYIRQAGIHCNGACHVLRHSMATSMLENGADIRYIQSLLGHASLDATQIYTRVSILKLKEVHRRTHPARITRHGQ